jgi:molybdate transport system ATP-binding protein
MRLLRIDALQDRLLPSLSNGEMRKILLARALLRRPRLLILDDPFSGLDPEFRGHLKDILEDLMRQGSVRLLLIVNHRDELPRGITHLLLVTNCRVVSQGRLREMLTCPSVRRLLDEDRRLPVLHRMPRRALGQSGSNPAELVRLEGISIQYGGHMILQNIDWTINRGESWALFGPNGSGKSTLLSLIVGDNPQAYANRVYVFGRRRGSGDSVWELKKRIGWVSPELHLHFPESQTCLETVLSGFQDSQGCYRRPAPKQIRTARQWLMKFGLSGFAESSFGSLSSGLQRVTLLARALVKSPDLLVLDEPCQGLDHAHRRQFIRAVETLILPKRTTLIYVTHRVEEIPRGIRRVLRLRDGRVHDMARLLLEGS